MIIEENKIGSTLIVKPLEKRLDADSSRDFKEKILDRISHGETTILLNLSEIEFVDSSGLGVLLSILRNLGQIGTLEICSISENVMRLFRLTRIDRVFQIYPEESEALAAMS